MKKFVFIISLCVTLILFTGSFTDAQIPGNPKGYLKGYYKTLKGDNFQYHSPQQNVNTSMIIRSMEKTLYVEWETEPVPADFKGKDAKFIFIAAIDVNPENPHSWEVFVNDRKEFTINSPADNNNKIYTWRGQNGYILDFNVTLIDQYGDQHGYMTLSAPEGKYEKGKPLKIKVVGESANSQTWFMIFKYAMEPELTLVEEQAVRQEGNIQFQQVRTEYVYMGDPVDVLITSGETKTNAILNFGYNIIRAKLPVVKDSCTFSVTISTSKGNQVIAKKDFTLLPVVRRTIHLLHHSHVDIGYTHVQDEVKQIQWRNLESAIKLASESQNFPEGERFKWNSEVMWPIESYLREKELEKVKLLKEAISKGWIEPDAFFANELTELCTTEELVQLTSDVRRITAECGIKPQAAMITDIPGWSWGIVPVLAKSGVKYLSLGTNPGHRIGGTIREWGDRPFYWVSPSGEEKILCWIHEKGYSLFHTGLKYDELKFRLDEGRIFGYLNDLYENRYPYEIITLRYNIGSDNGPTDPLLSRAVKEWNEKYVTPKIKIMTVSESFSEFEKRYGDQIPSFSGAYTGYWEDGAASSAYETSINRKAAANINTAGALMVMNNNKGFQPDKIDDAWRNVLLFDEHTWGSWNSISEPENPFTLSQWAIKRSFAITAQNQSNALINSALSNNIDKSTEAVSKIEILNTHSWNISDMITIPSGMNIAGTRVTDLYGNVIPSQKLTSGDVVFIAKDIPAFGSKIFSLSSEDDKNILFDKNVNQIENEDFLLKVDPITGSAETLLVKAGNIDLADKSKLPGLNSYYYVAGRSPGNKYSVTASKYEVIDNGPVTSVLKVSSFAAGAKSITNYYRLVNGIYKINLTSVIDKEKVYTPEGVHLGFPFNVPGGVVRLDLAYGIYRPEEDQLVAACKNYFTPEKWVDISNQDYGLTLVTNDAPLIEIGDITTDATAFGWITTLKPSQTIYSYVMNNYWETNYKADQEGAVTFRYTIQPHGMFIPLNAEKLSVQESEPLIAVPVNAGEKEMSSLLTINNENIIATSLIPLADGYLLRLFNAGGKPASLDITFRDSPAEFYFSDFDGNKTGNFVTGTIIPAWGIRTLRVRK
jgi:alpha-mannosidase